MLLYEVYGLVEEMCCFEKKRTDTATKNSKEQHASAARPTM